MGIKCPLCGYRFNIGAAQELCTSCPMNSGCKMICCPNCHYAWLESSSWVSGLLELAKKGLKHGRS